jgi:hypothetical protein
MEKRFYEKDGNLRTQGRSGEKPICKNGFDPENEAIDWIANPMKTQKTSTETNPFFNLPSLSHAEGYRDSGTRLRNNGLT